MLTIRNNIVAAEPSIKKILWDGGTHANEFESFYWYCIGTPFNCHCNIVVELCPCARLRIADPKYVEALCRAHRACDLILEIGP